MLQVLGRTTSINVRKVLWVCDEIGLPFAQEDWGTGVDPQARSTHTAEFKTLNPNALVPVIRDADFVLWESNTICRYLAAQHGRDDLLPLAPRARAEVEKWMDWQAGELNNAWRYAFQALVRLNPAYADPTQTQASIQNWNRHMQMLNAQLDAQWARGGAFVAGPTFTLADVVLGLATQRWLMTPIERPELPAVLAYLERLSQRPAFMRHGRNGVP
jgi:glutathione S-transferase